MRIHTNDNNLATLKMIIAAKLANKKVELVPASISGPRQLPWLEVDEELRFFSSNAAAQFLFPILDLYGQCQQIQEWEATRLYPSMVAALDPKSAVDSKQLLSEAIQQIDTLLGTKAYVLGDLLSAADISLWATLYPVYYNEEHRNKYLANASNFCTWYQQIANSKAVQEAVKQWGGSANIPLAQLSALGCPQIPTLLSPSGPQDNTVVVTGPTAEELSFAQECWLNGFRNLPELLPRQKPILPVKGRKNILITSALPYVNNVPHLGNIIGCVLSADIFARYCRICDYNTLFICGTDEYGTATETKALEEGISPREICDKYFAIHNEVYRWFNIGFDCFGRTSTPHQTEITQKMFSQLHSNGFVSSQTVDQLLCQKCDMFLADRFVEGTCPHAGCGYEDARGDQCDRCGRLVNATELLAPRCKQCGATPALRQSAHLFLELPQLEASVRNWVSAHLNEWSPSARGVARAWLRDGLRARCITRDLKWGVPVPLEPYTDKVFYVWFDAPMGYLSITKRYTDHYEKWWRPDPEDNVKLYQFMAKDNVPFHTIMFPAVLIGVNQGHKLVDHVFATEYLNYEEGKFSKSRGVGVFGSDAQDTGIPADIWRFYLASIRPEGQDSSFSWLELGTRNNSELLNNVGNFCHRALSFVRASLGGVVPAVPAPLPAAAARTASLVNRECAEYVVEMERGRIREALRCVLAVARLGNQHMQAEQPWALLKGAPADRSRGEQAVALCCQLAALVCVLLAPYMPDVAEALRAQLAMPRERMRIDPRNPGLIQYLPDGHKIGTPEPLFTKIEPERLMDLKQKYAGTQSDRANRENGDLGSEPTGVQSVQDLEAAVARQGEKVRQLKASTKDKTVWQPEVNALLELKKRLAAAQNSAAQPSGLKSEQKGEQSAQELERAIAEQGDKVRKLKASTKDKSVWAPEVNVLLDLKKKLAALQTNK